MVKKQSSKPIRLVWHGKKHSELAPAQFTVTQTHEENNETGTWRNKLFCGDNQSALTHLQKHGFRHKINLIYIDPPFGTGSDLNFAAGGAHPPKSPKAYVDSWGQNLESYLQMMYERLLLMKDLLAENGSIYVHLDYHAANYIKIIMDEIFGTENLVNQIIWQRTGAHNDPQSFGRNYDIILFYQKSGSRTWNEPRVEYDEAHLKRYFRQAEKGRRFRLNNPTGKGYNGQSRDFGSGAVKPPQGRHWSVSQEQIDLWLKEERIVFTSSGYPFVKKYLDELSGRQVQSVWTDLIPPRSSRELTGYPTQKPEKLLERIVQASSNPGDLVADFFCGSGTTLAVAERLERSWVGSDSSETAVKITEDRLKKIAEVKSFEVLRA